LVVHDGHVEAAVVASQQGFVVAKHFGQQAEAEEKHKQHQAVKAKAVMPEPQPSTLGGRQRGFSRI
jgi:hypothetical protein